jgi:GNAT superfamily N-acetyltransferase
MALSWTKENPPRWDVEKARIVGGAALGFDGTSVGDLLAGEWWRVDADGVAAGYGWIDLNWGDGEMLLAVDPARQGQGVGSFIHDRLQEEARSHGL